MSVYRYTTPHGVTVSRTASREVYEKGLSHLVHELDRHRGVYLSSGMSTRPLFRWDVAALRLRSKSWRATAG